MDYKAEFSSLQSLIDYLYRERKFVTQIDVLVTAEIFDLTANMQEIINLLPPGTYQRQRLCDQINSALTGHGWASSTAPLSSLTRGHSY